FHHGAQLVAAGVLEDADGHNLVELGMDLAEVGLADFELVGQALLLDLAPEPPHLLRSRVHAAHPDAALFPGPEHEAAEAAADVDDALAGLEPDLAAHVVDLVLLRLLHR